MSRLSVARGGEEEEEGQEEVVIEQNRSLWNKVTLLIPIPLLVGNVGRLSFNPYFEVFPIRIKIAIASVTLKRYCHHHYCIRT